MFLSPWCNNHYGEKYSKIDGIGYNREREVLLLFYKAVVGGEVEKFSLKWKLLQFINLDRNNLKKKENRIQGIEGNITKGVLD